MDDENKPIICVDLDGVLNAFDGWKGADFFHPPRPGAREFLKELNAKGQPVLVGTVSVEKSEKLSKILSKMGVRHEVLNAKNHEREAFLVAQAGRKGVVTVSKKVFLRGS